MSSLQPVYLANVVLYLQTIQTAENFTLINHKCKEALEILHINPGFISSGTFAKHETERFATLREYVLHRELRLFPLLQTVVLRTKMFSQQIVSTLPKQFQRIVIEDPISSQTLTEALYHEAPRIISAKFSVTKAVDLSKFPNLQKVVIQTNADFKGFFPKKRQRFEQVSLLIDEVSNTSIFQSIQDYNFGKLFAYVSSKQVALELAKISTRNFFIICSEEFISPPPNVYFSHKRSITSINFFQEYFPSTIHITADSPNLKNPEQFSVSKNADYCNFARITNGAASVPTSVTQLRIERGVCTNMNELKVSELHIWLGLDIVVPPTVTKLTIGGSKNIKISNPSKLSQIGVISSSVQVPINDMTNITSLDASEYVFNQSISHLTNLKRLDLMSSSMGGMSCKIIPDISTFYPSTLTKLQVDNNLLPPTLHALELDILYRNATLPNKLNSYTSLTGLRLINIYSNELELPPYLQYLHLDDCQVSNTIDITKYSTLKEVYMSSCTIGILFPTNLQVLTLGKWTKLLENNLNDVHLNKLAVFSDKGINILQCQTSLQCLYIGSEIFDLKYLNHFTSLTNLKF